MRYKAFLFLLVFLLASQLVLAKVMLNYESERIIIPSSAQSIAISAANLENSNASLEINCSSSLVIQCPDVLEIGPNEVKTINIIVKTGRDMGVFPVDFSVGIDKGTLNIRVSDSPKTLLNILNSYNQSLSALKKSNILDIRELEEAGIILGRAYKLYEEGSYYDSNSLVYQIQTKIENASRRISEIKLSQNTVVVKAPATGFSVASLQDSINSTFIDFSTFVRIISIILIIIVAIVFVKCFPYLRKKEKITFAKISPIKNELGAKNSLQIRKEDKDIISI